jgi:hypothetical protein
MPWTPTDGKKHNLLKQRFGLLTVIAEDESQMDGCGTVRARWKVKCDCGAEFSTQSRYLKRGGRTSCDSKPCKAAVRGLFP